MEIIKAICMGLDLIVYTINIDLSEAAYSLFVAFNGSTVCSKERMHSL